MTENRQHNPGRNPVQSAADGGPYPDPRSAFMLTVGAFFASGLVGVFFIGLGAVVAIGLGQAIAVGAIATLASKRVAEPQASRMGLRGFDLNSLPLVLCLVPAILLASELDNYASDFTPTSAHESDAGDSDYGMGTEIDRDDEGGVDSDAPASSEAGDEPEAGPFGAERELSEVEREALAQFEVDLEDPWTIAQAFVISVGITPIIEEFFFRGVMQQSLVARLGLVRGVGFVALLYTLPHLPAVATVPRFFAGLVSAFGMGCLLGLVRIATGSILGSILLASLAASVSIFAFAVRERLPLPGMNIDGTHLPVTVTLASLIIVAWAANSVYIEAKRRFEAEKRPS